MGNVQVDYEEGRGGLSEEDKDYFKFMLGDQGFAKSQEMYNATSDEVRAKIDEIFGGNIFEDSNSANTWLDDNLDGDVEE